MLRTPLDIPCSVCGKPAGARCVYIWNEARRGDEMISYHVRRKLEDLPAAIAAEQALSA